MWDVFAKQALGIYGSQIFRKRCWDALNTKCGNMYIYVYIDPSIHPSIHTYIRTYIHTYMHTSIHTFIHPYIHTSIHPSIHACMHPCMHTYKHVCLKHVCVYITSLSHTSCRLTSFPLWLQEVHRSYALPSLPKDGDDPRGTG